MRRGLSDLKVGALLSLVSYAIILIALLASLPSLLTFALTFEQPEELFHTMETIASPLSIPLLAVLAAMVVSLAALYKFFKATGHLKRFDAPRLGIGRLGVLLGIAGVLVILLGSIAVVFALMTSILLNAPAWSLEYLTSLEHLTLSGLYALIGVLVIGAIAAVIGEILFVVMIMRLGDIEGLDKGFRTAGILFLAGIVAGFIPLVSLLALVLEMVALVLTYRYSENSLRSLASVHQL